ncbi:hypothetical protein BDP55DRAFT_744238 [Colletotrichum godetiae]|uniref:Uncharacterized protein n=1 Tax=Colletotrichum godetiae TaxID=1209918 RepID=A0AAJ0ESS9_9PEZI|nr:uncharacterized protein BDP55DRAFT_744238 [Colletotrichum godetiae]KAK1675396.1 hypothetical protein BDP55DRAFT_744238 [Colletotrichum godetiae]
MATNSGSDQQRRGDQLRRLAEIQQLENQHGRNERAEAMALSLLSESGLHPIEQVKLHHTLAGSPRDYLYHARQCLLKVDEIIRIRDEDGVRIRLDSKFVANLVRDPVETKLYFERVHLALAAAGKTLHDEPPNVLATAQQVGHNNVPSMPGQASAGTVSTEFQSQGSSIGPPSSDLAGKDDTISVAPSLVDSQATVSVASSPVASQATTWSPSVPPVPEGQKTGQDVLASSEGMSERASAGLQLQCSPSAEFLQFYQEVLEEYPELLLEMPQVLQGE